MLPGVPSALLKKVLLPGADRAAVGRSSSLRDSTALLGGDRTVGTGDGSIMRGGSHGLSLFGKPRVTVMCTDRSPPPTPPPPKEEEEEVEEDEGGLLQGLARACVNAQTMSDVRDTGTSKREEAGGGGGRGEEEGCSVIVDP